MRAALCKYDRGFTVYSMQASRYSFWELAVIREVFAPMNARGFVTLVISLLMVSCMLSPASSAVTAVFPSPTPNPPATPQASAVSLIPSPTAHEPTPTPSTGSFELIGHTPLLNRGMNAAPAVYGNYAYVGSRTDGSHPDAGVLVVDISNPASPAVVHQIGPPEEGLPGQTSRELRVWPEQELLMVLNFHCEARLHDCGLPTVPPQISFYDISGANATQPRLIAIHSLGRTPHEFFLWDDPKVAGRALLYVSTPGSLSDNLLV